MFYSIRNVLIFLLLVSCTTLDRNRSAPIVVDADSVKMLFDIPRKRVEFVDYNYKSHTKVYDGSILRKEEKDNADFKIRYELKKSKDKMTYLMKTIDKVGDVNLKDMAFPELNKTIKLVVNSSGLVLDAKKLDDKAHVYSKDDLIYMPILSLPDKKIGVGDSWNISYTWSGTKGLSYITDLRSEAVAFYECELDELCVEIKLDGNVTIPEGEILGIVLKSELSGRILLNTRLGTVLWSNFATKDRLASGPNVIESKSCVESMLADPVVRIWRWGGNKPDCKLTTNKPIPGV